jgi:serine/threonine protein kinase
MQKSAYDLVGTQIGRIKIVGVLGEGGMGAVYEGRDSTLQRSVAVKVLREEFQFQKESKARFLREARILSKLDHPNICTVHDYVEDSDSEFLVMELVNGQNLRKALKNGLSHSEKLRIARQLLEVLVAVHGQGVIHRDLKPENVMISEDRSVKVLDFGLSRSAAEDWFSSTAVTVAPGEEVPYPVHSEGSTGSIYVKTQRGTVLGTMGYMSPEQARGEQATPASDIYSLGLVLQEMFTERQPFPRDLMLEKLMELAVAGRTEKISELPSDLTALLNRLKDPQPGLRPSAIDALATLDSIIGKPKRRRRLVLLSAISSIIVALGLGFALQWNTAKQEKAKAALEMERASALLWHAAYSESQKSAISGLLFYLLPTGEPTIRVLSRKRVTLQARPGTFPPNRTEARHHNRCQILCSLIVSSVYVETWVSQQRVTAMSGTCRVVK